MDLLMLEGWTPLILMGIIAAILMFLISRKVSKKALYITSSILTLIAIVITIYSTEVVDSWAGFGIFYLTIILILGVWIGTIIGAINKHESK